MNTATTTQPSATTYLSWYEQLNEEPLFLSKKPAAVLHDFQVAIGVLLFACTLVTVLMHLLVPGL